VQAIDAAYTLLISSLHAIAPEVMSRVEVLVESTTMLRDPGNYWISVINVGRAFPLNRIQAIDDTDQVDFFPFANNASANNRHCHTTLLKKIHTLFQAGFVIGSMMHVADLLSIGATEIRCSSDEVALNNLAIDYFTLVNNIFTDVLSV
jgi:hypothetical protein